MNRLRYAHIQKRYYAYFKNRCVCIFDCGINVVYIYSIYRYKQFFGKYSTGSILYHI